MSGHTPGPWSHWESYTGQENSFEVGPGRFDTVAHVRLGCEDVAGDCEANARLIAAAPDLLTALAGYLVLGKGKCVIGKDMADKALAAVNKATGRS